MERVVEPGIFDIMVGTSSRDIRHKFELEVTGEPRILGEEWRMKTEVYIS